MIKTLTKKRYYELLAKERDLEKVKNRYHLIHWFSAYPFAYNLLKWLFTGENEACYSVGVDQARSDFTKQLDQYISVKRKEYKKLVDENHQLQETIETLRYLDKKKDSK